MARSTTADRAAAALMALRRFGAACAPVARRALVMLGRAALACGRFGRRHRAVLAAASHRLMWWGAVLLLVIGGRPVLSHDPLPSRELLLAPFVAGLVLCAAVRLVAPARHLRLAALGLGALHVTGLALVWAAFSS